MDQSRSLGQASGASIQPIEGGQEGPVDFHVQGKGTLLQHELCPTQTYYIHEKFLAPTGLADVQDRVGIAKLTPVQPGDIGVTPMKAHKLNEVIEIFPDTLGPEYRRTRASANKEGNAAEKASGEVDEFCAVIEASAEQQRKAVLQKYMDECHAALMGLAKKGKVGGERARQKTDAKDAPKGPKKSQKDGPDPGPGPSDDHDHHDDDFEPPSHEADGNGDDAPME